MKIYSNTKHLTGAVLATLACASFVGCTRTADREVMNSVPDQTTMSGTSSGTTVAANDESAPPTTMDNTGAVPPAAADESAMKSESSTTTKSTKHMKSKHKAERVHKKHSAGVAPAPALDEDAYAYRDDDATNGALVSPDDDDTVSATTMAPSWGETGLSPFAQEPGSRIPTQIGSGQITGEDKSTTILDGPSLFQDPAALGRSLLH